MALTISTLRGVPYQFSETDYPDDVVQALLDTAKSMSNFSEDATYYLAAHLLTLWNLEGGTKAMVDDRGGIIVGETIGPKALQFKSQARDNRDVFYLRTPWGRLYLQLRRSGLFRMINA